MTDSKQDYKSPTLEYEAPPPSYQEASPRNLQPSSQAYATPAASSSSSSSQHSVFKPIVIPQTTPTHTHSTSIFPPFPLAYSQVLAHYTITQPEFRTFISGLNSAFTASQGASIFSSAGTAISNIHLPIIPLVGRGVAAAAGIGSWAKGRSYVKEANEMIFGPKGLRIQVLKTGKMTEAVGGRGGADGMREGEMFDVDPDVDIELGLRRLRALGDRVQPLVFEGEEKERVDTWWKRWGEREADRRDAKMERKGMRRMGRKYEEREIVEKEKNLYWIVIDKIDPTKKHGAEDEVESL